MPAFYTHFTFVKKNIDPKDKYAQILALGGQGPDVFFYYGYSLAKREKKSQKRYFGTFLHHTNISDAYSFLIEYACKQKDKDMLLAYIKGLFMHYIIDRNCHPYIFYRSGFSLNGQENPKYVCNHALFESILDKVYSKNCNTLTAPAKYIRCSKDDVVSISKMFYKLARFLKYDSIDKDTFYEAYKDFVFAQKALYSPLGVKKFFIHNVFCKNSLIDCMCMPVNEKKYDSHDVLNLSHRVWRDCISGIERTESFLELVDNGVKEVAKIDTVLKKAAKNPNVRDDIKKFVNNIDHDGFTVNKWKKHYCNFLDPKDTY